MAFPDPYPVEYWPASSWEVEGTEFDWFAQDRHGQLAAFTSAGHGYIPQQVFSAAASTYNEFISTIGRRPVSAVVLEFKGTGRYEDWRMFAAHGLYAFDFQDVHRSKFHLRNGYDLIYRPTCRAMVSDLPGHLGLYLPVIDTVFGVEDLVPSNLIRLD